MPAQTAVNAATLLIQSNRPLDDRPHRRRPDDSSWRESQRQQRRAEFWQSLMGHDRS